MGIILQTPSIVPFLPFDPSNIQIVEFTYSGNQAIKNRVVITNNTTGNIVYDETQTTMKLQHEIQENSLIAGVQYLIQVQVFDAQGNNSNLSEPILFYCFTTPTFLFLNISDNDTYRNASIELEVFYSQLENEQLKSIQYLQYSYDKVLLSKSDTLFNLYSHTFYGLKNNTPYYFRAIGETVHGILLDTGYVKLNIEYKTLPANIIFKAENNRCEGFVKLTSNIKDIEYEFDNDNYVLKDGLLTLKENSLTYKNSFNVYDDFVLFVVAKSLPLQKFLTTNNNEFSLSIINVCDEYYCKLALKNSDFSQYAILPREKLTVGHNEITVKDNNLIIFEVRRIGWNYSIKSYYKSEIEQL